MRKHTVRQYAKALYAMTAELPEKLVPKALDAFVEILIRERILHKAEQLLLEYESYAEKMTGASAIDVVSKHALDGKIKKIIQEKFGKKRRITEAIDETLAGGCIIKDGDIVYDATIDTQLKKLAYHIIH